MKTSQTIKKISAQLLAIFLLITSIGVEVNAHYCKTKLVSLNIWNEAKSCTQETEQDIAENTPDVENFISKQGCCNSKTVFSKTDIESEVDLSYVKLFSAFPTISTNTIHTIPAYNVSVGTFTSSSPPFKYSRSVLYQRFRI